MKELAVPADKLHITLAGREHVVEAGTTAGDALASAPESAAPSLEPIAPVRVRSAI